MTSAALAVMALVALLIATNEIDSNVLAVEQAKKDSAKREQYDRDRAWARDMAERYDKIYGK